MAVLETGILLTGIPILRIDFYREITGDPLLKAGFFTAFQEFANTIFDDETEEFKMKKYLVVLRKGKLRGEDQEVTLYVVCDARDSSSVIKKRIDKVLSLFIKAYPEVNALHLERYQDFLEVIKEEFRDLQMRPVDRARRLFG